MPKRKRGSESPAQIRASNNALETRLLGKTEKHLGREPKLQHPSKKVMESMRQRPHTFKISHRINRSRERTERMLVLQLSGAPSLTSQEGSDWNILKAAFLHSDGGTRHH